jgi:exopolysaccharide biosynthesis polyprenyl glycosylphosphotransferase
LRTGAQSAGFIVTPSVAVKELYDALDSRTLEILERRRGTPVVRRRGWLVRRALVSADLLGLVAAFVVAELVFPIKLHNAGALNQLSEVLVFAFTLAAWVVAAKLYGLYDKDEERTNHSTTDDLAGVFHLVTIGAWLLYAASLLTDWFNPQFGKLFVFWLMAVLGVTFLRGAARAYCRRQIHYLQNTIIIGAGDVGQTIARKILKHPEYGIHLVGFVDSQPKERMRGLGSLTLLGTPGEVTELVGLLDIERVIVAFSNDGHALLLDLIRKLNELDVQVDVVPRFFEVLSPRVDMHSIEGVVLCGLPSARLPWSSRLLKRGLDLAGSFVGMVLLSPLFAVVALAIKLDSRGPVFFRQVRKGEHDTFFRIWKFRSMATDADERKIEVAHLSKHARAGGDNRMFKIDDDPRVTRVGRRIRHFSIDELPQLWNVLRGEMSLVGPRPLILGEHAFVTAWAGRRVDLKPGITGLWQVLGRDGIAFEEMVRLDYLYVTSWSLGGDLRLLLRTIPIVARGA